MNRIGTWLYSHSPAWLQNLELSLFGLAYRHERTGGQFDRYVREFRERESWSREQFDGYMAEQLRAVLLRAAAEVPYYGRTWPAELPGSGPPGPDGDSRFERLAHHSQSGRAGLSGRFCQPGRRTFEPPASLLHEREHRNAAHGVLHVRRSPALHCRAGGAFVRMGREQRTDAAVDDRRPHDPGRP